MSTHLGRTSAASLHHVWEKSIRKTICQNPHGYLGYRGANYPIHHGGAPLCKTPVNLNMWRSCPEYRVMNLES